MQAEVIYHHGTLTFKHPLRFRQVHFTMQVEIPEHVIAAEEIILPTFDFSLFSAEVQAEIARLKTIQQQAINQVIHEVKEETEEQRILWAAFELRNEIRREQGRDL